MKVTEYGSTLNIYQLNNKALAVVGFEPTPRQRLEPKSSALDHSATLPVSSSVFRCLLFVKLETGLNISKEKDIVFGPRDTINKQ